MIKQFVYIVALIAFLFSCQTEQQKEKDRITRLVEEWQGKQIQFPDNPIFTRYVKDTVDYIIPESEYKVLVYVDSLGCTGCKLQLAKWVEFIDSIESIEKGDIPFIFFFHPKKKSDVYIELKQNGFDRPVCLDMEDQLNNLNQFPSDINFQTFLLNKENKVVVVGNPVRNLAVRDLYLKYIIGEGEHVELTTTTLTCEPLEYDLGTVRTNTVKRQTITVTNSGSTVFKLKGITTSCDCTDAVCDWNELQPGENGTILVSYKAEEPGDFYRTIDVFGNTKYPLTVSFVGTVKE